MLKFFTRPQPAPASPTAPVELHPVQLRPAETDATFEIGRRMTATGEYRDRYDYDRYQILLNCIHAWRVNPLARRCIELTTQFILGAGITVDAGPNQAFIDQWRDHPVNQIAEQLPEWADEMWRSGNLFLVGAVDDAGMTYWRPLPAEIIGELETYANDPYRLKRVKLTDMQAQQFFGYKRGVKRKTFVLHFPINRPAGADWGESDLAPILRYLSLYTDWLIDRAALNKYMKPSYIVQRPFNSQPEKDAFSKEVRPPVPGSTIVADPNEIWGTLNVALGSFDASLDGSAIKKMIAAGMGFPLHYLAEPESSTRTTAEAAGTPTYRRLLQRQTWFVTMYQRVIQTTLEVRALWAGDVNPNALLKITPPDISERDNAQMALGANRVSSALLPYWDAIGGQEVVNMIYRFAGEKDIPTVKAGAQPLGTQAGSAEEEPHERDPEAQEVSA